MKLRSVAILSLCLVAAGSPSASPSTAAAQQGESVADEDAGQCYDFTSADVGPGAPRFPDYATAPQRLRPAPVKMTRDFSIFRTKIRNAAAEGPNFAGHFTFASWGMAIGQRCWAIVDSKTGVIHAEAMPGPDRPGPYSSQSKVTCVVILNNDIQEPQFRLDSRLLILTGQITDNRLGVAYYEWTGTQLRELRFYPAADLCRDRSARAALRTPPPAPPPAPGPAPSPLPRQ